MLCLHSIFGCPWQGQLQHFEVGASLISESTVCDVCLSLVVYHISSHLQGHCRDCKYKPVRCPNPGCSELLPAEKLGTHGDGDCQFRKVACDHCREETAANQLEVRLMWTYCIYDCVLLIFLNSANQLEVSIVTNRVMHKLLFVFCFSYPGPSKPVSQGSNEVWEMSGNSYKRCSKCA